MNSLPIRSYDDSKPDFPRTRTDILPKFQLVVLKKII
jgi:hypothetical protein